MSACLRQVPYVLVGAFLSVLLLPNCYKDEPNRVEKGIEAASERSKDVGGERAEGAELELRPEENGVLDEVAQCPGAVVRGGLLDDLAVLRGFVPGSALLADAVWEVASANEGTWYGHADGVRVLPTAKGGVVVVSAADVEMGGRRPLERVWVDGVQDGMFGSGWTLGLGPNAAVCGREGYVCDVGGRVEGFAFGGTRFAVSWSGSRVVAVTDGAWSLAFRYGPGGRLASIEGPGGVVSTYAYDNRGLLVRVQTSDGGFDYGYDESGRLKSAGRGGAVVSIERDQGGRLAGLSGPGDRTAGFEYRGSDGSVMVVTNPSGNETTFDLSGGSQNITITDPLKRVTTKKYSQDGMLKVFSISSGPNYAFSYIGGRLASVESGENRVWSIEYSSGLVSRFVAGGMAVVVERDRLGRIVGVVDESGNSTKLELDSCGRVTSRDRSGVGRLEYKYDRFGRCIEVSNGKTLIEKRAFDDKGRVVSYTEANGGTWGMKYEPNGRLLSRTDPIGRSEFFRWNSDGQLAEYKDFAGRITSYSYGAASELVEVSVEGESVIKYSYGKTGNVEKSIVRGEESTFKWDSVGRQIEKADMHGILTNWVWNDRDQLESVSVDGVELWRGTWTVDGRLAEEAVRGRGVVRFEHDGIGRVVAADTGSGRSVYGYGDDGSLKVTHADGSVQVWVPDAGGVLRLSSWAGGFGETAKWNWSADGRLLSSVEPDGEVVSWAYDKLGQPVTVQSTKRGKAEYGFDSAGRIKRITEASGVSREYSYNKDGRLSAVSVAGSTTSYDWDAAGRLAGIRDPAGDVTRFTYDRRGLPESRVLPDGSTWRYKFNGAGEPLEVQRPDGVWERYEYNELGLLSLWKSGDTVMKRMSYDGRGRIAKVSGEGYDLEYDFRDDGRLNRVNDISAGIQLVYHYDNNGRPESVDIGESQSLMWTYDSAGRVTAVTPRGAAGVALEYSGVGLRVGEKFGAVSVELERDEAGRLLRQRVNGGGAASEVGVEWDEAGRVKSRKWGPGQESAYGYDAAGRLAQAVEAGETVNFGYDPSGSISQVGKVSLLPGRSQYPAVGPKGMRRHSDWGWLTAQAGPDGQALRFEYDLGGRLAKVSGLTSVLATYGYDGSGRLVAAGDGVGQTRLVSFNGVHLADVGPSGVKRYYIVTPDGKDRLGFVEDGSSYYFVRDLDNSVIGVVNESGEMINEYRYNAYGARIRQRQRIENPYGYQGHFTDKVSGLVHYPGRWYDPSVGSFVQPDPMPGLIMRPESLNRYVFAEGDPLNRRDELGLQAHEWSLGASSLEKVCNLFQAGKIQASYAYGRTLDGFSYVGAVEKGGWVHDIWVKRIPGSDRVLTIFRDLNEKSGGYFGKPNLTGNLVLDPVRPNPQALVPQGSAAGPQSGGFMSSLSQGVQNVRLGLQSYGKEVTTTMAGLGGTMGTLNTSVGTLAALPGGTAIIGAGAAAAALAGYGAGTIINKSETVQKGTQAIIGNAMGYDKSQIVVNIEKEGELKGDKMKDGEVKAIAKGLARDKASGVPEEPSSQVAGGTAGIGEPVSGRNRKDRGGGVPDVVEPKGGGSDAGAPDAGGSDGGGADGGDKPAGDAISHDITIEDVPPVLISINIKNSGDYSYGEFTNIVTCIGPLTFWNVGSLIPGKGGASMTLVCTSSLNGTQLTQSMTGTFSGGPNGSFSLHGEEGSVSFSLQGGAKVVIPELGTYVNPNPGAFANWPKTE